MIKDTTNITDRQREDVLVLMQAINEIIDGKRVEKMIYLGIIDMS